MTSVKIVDFYRVLEIQQDASQEEVKRAYHRALLRHHPDKKRAEDAVLTPTTIPAIDTLREAFKMLSSPSSRQIYDQTLRSSISSSQTPKTVPRPANVVSLDDFQEVNQGESSAWTHPCRCGGTFVISEQLLDEDIHLVGCDCCSEVVWSVLVSLKHVIPLDGLPFKGQPLRSPTPVISTTPYTSAMSKGIYNTVPNTDSFISLNEPAIGTAFNVGENTPKLFQPLTIRNTTFKNRIWVSPMCQYSSKDGKPTDWHFVHLGSFATRGAGAITVEATAVLPEGRITPQDSGLWSDDQIPGFKRIVDFVHTQGTLIGIQLGHAGRKASTYAPWVSNDHTGRMVVDDFVAPEEQGGWPDKVLAPSAIPWSPTYPKPKAMSLEQIQEVKDAFVAAVKRAKVIGFDFIEIHAAHGYLMTSFVSPISNVREDQYGGSFENRVRLPVEVINAVRKEWSGPLFCRISASEWAEPELGPEKDEQGEWKWWGPEQSTQFAGLLKEAGVDLLDVSSGGNYDKQKITVESGYQVPFAQKIKAAHPDLLVAAVGLITSSTQAEGILQEGKADAVFLARELLRRIDFPLIAADELGVAVKPANQYSLAWRHMLAKA